MNKQLGAILLVAGTCIGSGMIALPMVMAKLGLIPSLILMAGIWSLMYYTSLVNVELNLQAGNGLSLGALGKRFSGGIAEWMGTVSLKLLSYSLLAVFIYGGTSIVQELSAAKIAGGHSFENIATCFACLSAALLLLPIEWIDYCNRLLFCCLLVIVAILLTGLVMTINWAELPLFSGQYSDPAAWISVIPVVFTSFGFQVIFHTLTNYCRQNVHMLKQAFLWGSLIPAVVYIVWTCCILSVVYQDNPDFYKQMALGKVEVGQLIQTLSDISEWQSVQLLIWWISLLAIVTSILGVGVGLCDSLKGMLAARVPNPWACRLLSSVITVLPAYLIVMYVPNAFIAVLGFAGMILAVIAVLLPTYLFWQIKAKHFHYSELNKKYLVQLSFGAAIAVVACELWGLFISSYG